MSVPRVGWDQVRFELQKHRLSLEDVEWVHDGRAADAPADAKRPQAPAIDPQTFPRPRPMWQENIEWEEQTGK